MNNEKIQKLIEKIESDLNSAEDNTMEAEGYARSANGLIADAWQNLERLKDLLEEIDRDPAGGG